MSTIQVSSETLGIVFRRLGINSRMEVVNRDYKGFSLDNDIEREKQKTYSSLIRGSIRLQEGKYYTAHEYEEKIKRSLERKIP